MVPAEHNKAKTQGILNAFFFIILAYQFILLISGILQYSVQIHLHVMLYPASFLLIFFYQLIGYTKDSGIQWGANRLKLFKDDEPDTSAGEMMYNLQKWIVLILAIIFSVLAVIFAFINIFEHWVVFCHHILSFIGISALLILMLTITLGIRVIIKFILKPWEKTSNIFKMLLLQNFLISTGVLKMLANIQG